MTRKSFIAQSSMVLVFAASAFAQQRFDTPEAAANAAIDGAEKHDTAALAALFGPQGNAILTSGNTSQDRSEQTEFAKLARAKHLVIADPMNSNRAILSVGDEDWPFPVPIVRSDGKWAFDPAAAKVEMEARRIGGDELDALEICAGYVDAQRRFASEDHDKDGMLHYAAHMMSGEDGKNGLFQQNVDQPLVPEGLAQATSEGQKRSAKPYHGYYFRILEGQGPNAPGGAHSYVVKGKLMGGFGLVAWPAQYGVTGIHTFIVNQDGVIYQKDIAPSPAGGGSAVTRYDPDPTWTPSD